MIAKLLLLKFLLEIANELAAHFSLSIAKIQLICVDVSIKIVKRVFRLPKQTLLRLNACVYIRNSRK